MDIEYSRVAEQMSRARHTRLVAVSRHRGPLRLTTSLGAEPVVTMGAMSAILFSCIELVAFILQPITT